MNINISGVNILKKKNILFGLTKIFGIGIKKSKMICDKLKIDKNKKIFDLNLNIIEKINSIIANISIENELKVIIKDNIKKILNLNNYKSSRHKKKLPCRGQRTKTNSRTRRKLTYES